MLLQKVKQINNLIIRYKKSLQDPRSDRWEIEFPDIKLISMYGLPRHEEMIPLQKEAHICVDWKAKVCTVFLKNNLLTTAKKTTFPLFLL